MFFTTNSYLPLILTNTHRWSPATAGIPLVVGSLGWSAAFGWQGRHPDLPRPLIGAGGALLSLPVLLVVLAGLDVLGAVITGRAATN